jgi:hypothetical protein
MRRRRLAPWVLGLLLGPGYLAAGEPWQHLSELQIRAMLSDAELTDGKTFSHRYRKNGSFTGREPGGAVQGRWRIERDELCLAHTRPRPLDECFEVQSRKGELRLLQDGYVIWQGATRPAGRKPVR